MRSSGVSYIITPDPYEGYPYEPGGVTRRKMEHEPSKVEEIYWKGDHFRQAIGTPFTEGLMEWLPFTADSETAEKI